MTKKELIYQYLRDNTDWKQLSIELSQSWLYRSGYSFQGNGLIGKHMYEIELKAIEIASYQKLSDESIYSRMKDIEYELINVLQRYINARSVDDLVNHFDLDYLYELFAYYHGLGA